MTTQELLEKANKGGFNYHNTSLTAYQNDMMPQISNRILATFPDGYQTYVAIEVLILRPDFWEALGKSMGWDRVYHRTNYDTEPMRGHTKCTRFCKPTPTVYWHRLIDHLDARGTIESYIKNLV